MERTPERDIIIATSAGNIHGTLAIPHGATGIVVFAHGSGSGRHSPRNREVATALQDAGFATFLFDLLTAQEDAADTRGGCALSLVRGVEHDGSVLRRRAAEQRVVLVVPVHHELVSGEAGAAGEGELAR